MGTTSAVMCGLSVWLWFFSPGVLKFPVILCSVLMLGATIWVACAGGSSGILKLLVYGVAALMGLIVLMAWMDWLGGL